MDETEPRSHTLLISDQDPLNGEDFTVSMQCLIACA